MKKQLFIWIAVLAAVVFAGCTNDDGPDAPVIAIETPASYDISYKGEEFSVTYRVSTQARPYVDCSADWFRVAESNANGARIVVAPNSGVARTGKVVIWFYDAKPIEITVAQAAKPALSERLIVTVENVTNKEFEVVCQNLEGENLWYYYIAMKKDFYDENVAADPAAWVADNVKKKYASWKFLYDFEYVEDDFAQYYMLTNAQTDRLLFSNEISPETDYVVVAFDLDPQAKYSGEISTCAFKTKPIPAVEMIDMTFNINIEYQPQNQSYPYRLTITPSRDDNRYFYYVATQEDYQGMMTAFGNDIDKLVAAFREQFLEKDILWKYVSAGVLGESWSGFEDTDGDGKVSLVAIACGMDEYYRINSKAQASKVFVLDAAAKSPALVSRSAEPQRASMAPKAVLLERRADAPVTK